MQAMARITLLFSLILIPATSFAARTDFDDVPYSYEFRESILDLQERGIVRGYPDGNFYPDVRINRVEFTKIVIGALYEEEYIDTCLKDIELKALAEGADINFRILQEALDFEEIKFTDVDYNEWYGNALCMAQLENIVGGYNDGTFKPEQRVNFAEAATILARAFNVLKASRHQELDPVWYRPFVQDLEDLRAIPTSISGFDYFITRAEMAEMISRLLAHRETGKLTTSPYLTYSELAKSGEWDTYKNEELGFQFDYAEDWGKPYYVPRGFFDGGHPLVTSKWRIYLGPKAACTGYGECIERKFHLDGYDVSLSSSIVEDLLDAPLVTIISDRVINDVRMLVVEEGGICTMRSTLIFGEKYLYKLTSICGGDIPSQARLLQRIMDRFEVYLKKDRRAREAAEN